jgi:pyrroloquinoline quinone (PQQ) biosynthesis protein C
VKAHLDACVERLRVTVEAFPWEKAAAYADWLAQTYYYVRHSTRLLAAAAARFSLDARGNALHQRFGAHMGEEKQHEKLALHDLRELGASLENLPERSATRFFYEPQYYKIEHGHPIALFGYILPLEAIGPLAGAGVIERITRAHGAKCVSFLRLHAADDVDHLAKALEVLTALPPDLREVVAQNLDQSTDAFVGLLKDVAAGPRPPG